MEIRKENSKDVVEVVKSFINQRTSEEHRYSSWEFCYGLAQCMHERKEALSDEDYDYMALNLAVYLASWGMLRNSFLLQRSYKVHKKVVETILNDDRLWKDEVASETYKDTRNKVCEAYGVLKSDRITDTLFTKILLGMTGKVITYDRYCKDALAYFGMSSSFFGERARTWNKVREEILPCFSEIIESCGSLVTYHPYEYIENGHYAINKNENREYPVEKYLD